MDVQAENESLRAELAELKKTKSTTSKELKFKIGEKKGLSISGLSQRFPVTLYKKDWKYLLRPENVKKILIYINEHEDEMK
jgi:hypothetical protein